VFDLFVSVFILKTKILIYNLTFFFFFLNCIVLKEKIVMPIQCALLHRTWYHIFWLARMQICCIRLVILAQKLVRCYSAHKIIKIKIYS
jgi:hypothetical protein